MGGWRWSSIGQVATSARSKEQCGRGVPPSRRSGKYPTGSLPWDHSELMTVDDFENWSKLWRMTSSGVKRPEFIGLSLADAEEATLTGHLKVRIVGPPTPLGGVFSAEYAPSRLNLLVRDGIVIDTATS
jgi:hypothetical protein